MCVKKIEKIDNTFKLDILNIFSKMSLHEILDTKHAESTKSCEENIKKLLLDCAKNGEKELYVARTPYVIDFLRQHNFPWLLFDGTEKEGDHYNECRVWVPDFSPPHYYFFDLVSNGDYSSSFVKELHALYKTTSLNVLCTKIQETTESTLFIRCDSYRVEFLREHSIPFYYANAHINKSLIRIWLSKHPSPEHYPCNQTNRLQKKRRTDDVDASMIDASMIDASKNDDLRTVKLPQDYRTVVPYAETYMVTP